MILQNHIHYILTSITAKISNKNGVPIATQMTFGTPLCVRNFISIQAIKAL